jgi:hypothetical protein
LSDQTIISHGDNAYNFYITYGRLYRAKALVSNLGDFANLDSLLLMPNIWDYVAITNKIGGNVTVYKNGIPKATVPFYSTYNYLKNLHIGIQIQKV